MQYILLERKGGVEEGTRESGGVDAVHFIGKERWGRGGYKGEWRGRCSTFYWKGKVG